MTYDIAVLGAGPAGSTFARVAAENAPGKRIVLIDGQDEAHQKPCGGLLSPDAQKALAHFDLVLPKSVLVDPQIFSVKTMDVCSGRIRYYSRCYLNIDRYRFDRWLISLLPETVEIVPGRCTAVGRRDGGFVLTVFSGGVRREITARCLVGADGASSLVRKTFFPRETAYYVAIQQWFQTGEKASAFYSCLFDAATSESCSWSINKDGKFIFGGCFRPEDCRARFEAQKQRTAAAFPDFDFPEKKLLKTEACLALRPKKPGDFVTGRDGVYLVGEAAGFISPSSFEGISSAIISGHLLAEVFGKTDAPRPAARLYRRKTRRLRGKLTLKMLKRWFMYTPWVRALILKTGISSIDLWSEGRSGREKSGK